MGLRWLNTEQFTQENRLKVVSVDTKGDGNLVDVSASQIDQVFWVRNLLLRHRVIIGLGQN
jgi:hypothetical protein